MIQDRSLFGVALMLGFCMTAPFIDMFSKLAVQTLAVGQVTAARFVVQAALMYGLIALMRLPMRLSRRALGLTVLRAVMSILSTFTFIAALRVMPMADALAIAFVEPFIILLFGWAFMGETVGPRRLGACAVGFAGSLLVIQPSFMAFGLAALLPLGTAFFFAFYILVTRSLAGEQHPVAMQAHTAGIALIFMLPVLWFMDGTGMPDMDPTWPTATETIYMAGVGIAATVSHMFMTYALRYAPSSTVAPLHYTEMVSAAALGYLVFGDFPTPLTWVGIALICGSGLYIIHRERVANRQALRPVLPVAAGPASPGHPG